jgi:hypothetical protein
MPERRCNAITPEVSRWQELLHSFFWQASSEALCAAGTGHELSCLLMALLSIREIVRIGQQCLTWPL